MKLYQERREITKDNGQLYMVRWYIFKCESFNLMLHKILISDHEYCHDHPWNFISLILKGGYVETVEKEVLGKSWSVDDCDENKTVRTSKIIHPGQIIFRKAEHRHKLDIHQTCWSLVLRFKVKRKWGFWTKKGWVHWKLFSETENCS